jgi:hypothetical protein
MAQSGHCRFTGAVFQEHDRACAPHHRDAPATTEWAHRDFLRKFQRKSFNAESLGTTVTINPQKKPRNCGVFTGRRVETSNRGNSAR